MKPFGIGLLLLFLCCRLQAQPVLFTGTTPGHHQIIAFAGISATDTFMCIQWKLELEADHFRLQYRFQPDPAGGGPEQVQEVKGTLSRKGAVYRLTNGNRSLQFAVVNNSLLHLLDGRGLLLKGNGGWSFTLNRAAPVAGPVVYAAARAWARRDSMAFEGRTPCGNLDQRQGADCFKLKWLIRFYRDEAGQPSTFALEGTSFRQSGTVRGRWEEVRGQEGRWLHRLTLGRGGKLHLLQLDDHVMVFTDEDGNPLVGNADFSYTLNRRW